MVRRTRWQHTVKIGDLLDSDELTFEQRRDAIVARLQKSSAMKDGRKGEVLTDLVADLADADDENEYDWFMEDIYDLADSDKFLWVGP